MLLVISKERMTLVQTGKEGFLFAHSPLAFLTAPFFSTEEVIQEGKLLLTFQSMDDNDMLELLDAITSAKSNGINEIRLSNNVIGNAGIQTLVTRLVSGGFPNLKVMIFAFIHINNVRDLRNIVCGLTHFSFVVVVDTQSRRKPIY